jgi:hypothetical protein
MNTHTDTTSESRSQAVANTLPRQQSGDELSAMLTDDRPEAVAQRQLQETINNSPRVAQLRAYKEMANSSAQVKQLRAVQAMANSTSSITQRKEEPEKMIQKETEPAVSPTPLTAFAPPGNAKGVVQRYSLAQLGTVNPLALSAAQSALYSMLRNFGNELDYIEGLGARALEVQEDNPSLARTMRAKRHSIMNERDRLRTYVDEIPDNIFNMFARGEGAEVDAKAQEYANHIRNKIADIQAELRILAQPTRRFDEFMGDDRILNEYYTGDSKAKAIPIYWYKQISDYKDIKLTVPDENGKKNFTFPNGPSIVSNDETEYDLTAKDTNILKKGQAFKNAHLYEDRGVQQKIRRTLIDKYGFNSAGKDFDHIQDLGFGGVDEEDNIWPLDETINRRPFTGWRTLYGINYVNKDGEGKTGTLASMQSKHFKIKGTMDGGAVPDEGVRPDKYSGTDT